MKLAIVSNVAAPYRSELFGMVQKDIQNTTVFFQAIEEPNRSWPTRPSLPFSHSYLKGIVIPLGRRRLLFHPELERSLRHAAADVVVAYGFGTATVQCARYVRRRRKALVLANDGTVETDPSKGTEAAYRRRLIAKASGFIAASKRAAEYFTALGADAERIHVVHLTRDLNGARSLADEMRQEGNGHPSQEYTICVVARLVPDKRILDACKAVALLSERMPGIRLQIAGEGPMRQEIESWIQENGRGRIRLLGLLNWDELLRLYAASDAMIFPAKGEKYGMVMIEALACGVPVVAYENAGAAGELIVEGETGYLVPDGEWNLLALRLETILCEREKHERMRSAARRIVETHDITVQSKRFVDAVRAVRGRFADAGVRI
jgi:glycosyltransferase involved in cell wall biosynthesis